jgi:DNA-binding NarL/FixJ family response regulator
MSVRILIAGDRPVVRIGIAAMLAEEEGLEVVSRADDGVSAFQLADDHPLDLVLIELNTSVSGEREAVRRLLVRRPDLRVIVLGECHDHGGVSAILAAGARGYLLKTSCHPADLVHAVRTVIRGGVYVSPEVAAGVVGTRVPVVRRGSLSGSAALTARERGVLQLVAEGRSTKEIAADLHLSVKTVDGHRQRIMGRLDIRSVAGLTKYAVREGITSLEA